MSEHFGKAAREETTRSGATSEPGGRNVGAVIVSAVVFLLAAAGGAALSRAVFKPGFGATPAFVDAEIARYAQDNPGVAALYDALRTHYPQTYKDLTRAVAAELKRGDIDGAAEAAFQSTSRLNREKARHIAAASPERLAEWSRSALALMTAARAESPQLCAQVAFGDATPLTGSPSPALVDAVGRHAAATIAAFHDGETAPHAYAPVGPNEQATLARAAARQGLTPEDARKLTALSAVRALPPAEQCALGVKLLRGVAAAPEPVRTQVLSTMAAEAARRL